MTLSISLAFQQAIKSYTFYKGSPKTVESDKFFPQKAQNSQIEVGKLGSIIDDVEFDTTTTWNDFCNLTSFSIEYDAFDLLD